MSHPRRVCPPSPLQGWGIAALQRLAVVGACVLVPSLMPLLVAAEVRITEAAIGMSLAGALEEVKADPSAMMEMRLRYFGVPGERIAGERRFRDQVLEVIQVTSDSVESLNFDYESDSDGSTLSWTAFVPEARAGEIVIRARMRHALIGVASVNNLPFAWIDNWTVPVDRLLVVFTLPRDFQPTALSRVGDFEAIEVGQDDTGATRVSFESENLEPFATFKGAVSVRPGLVHDLGPLRYTKREVLLIGAVLFGVLMPLFYTAGRLHTMVRSRQKGGRRGGGGTDPEALIQYLGGRAKTPPAPTPPGTPPSGPPERTGGSQPGLHLPAVRPGKAPSNLPAELANQGTTDDAANPASDDPTNAPLGRRGGATTGRAGDTSAGDEADSSENDGAPPTSRR